MPAAMMPAISILGGLVVAVVRGDSASCVAGACNADADEVSLLTLGHSVSTVAQSDLSPDSSSIYVASEYARLREVIVGHGTGKQVDLYKAPWVKSAAKIFSPDGTYEGFLKAFGYQSGKSYKDFPWTDNSSEPDPTMSKYDKIEQENDYLIAALKKYGVIVHRPQELIDQDVADNFGEGWLVNGYQQIFSRDPIFIVGNNVVELSPSAPNRRGDLLGMFSLLHGRVEGTNANWIQMPTTNYTPMLLAEPPYSKNGHLHLEGGDLLVFNESTVLAGSSRNVAAGSSSEGIDWLASVLAPEKYTVTKVFLKSHMLHLDCALSIIKPGLATCCRDCLEGDIPSELDGWDIITVTSEEAKHLGTNGLPIDQSHYLLGVNSHMDGQRIKAELVKRGITVELIPFHAHNKDDGSLRCATHPFKRYD